VKRGVGILGRILRFLLWVLVIWWAAWLVKKLIGRQMRSGARRSSGFPGKPEAKPLRRDPVCGTYVSPEISLTLEHAGQVHHFCSAECRERFQKTIPRAVNE